MSCRPYITGLLLWVSLVGFGCTSQPQATVDADTYESILYEIELVFALHTQTMDRVRTQALLDSIWSAYGVNELDFILSHSIYERDVQGQLERIKRISARMSDEHQELENTLYELREEERLERRREAGID
jgi:hypothetical protein